LPTTLYGFSKKQTFELLSFIYGTDPCYAPFIWARIFWLFGENEAQTRLIPQIITKYKKNEIPTLKDPNLAHYFCYTGNVAFCLVQLLFERYKKDMNLLSNNRSVNICAGKRYSLFDLTKKIRDLFFEGAALPLQKDTSKVEQYPNETKFRDLWLQESFPYSFDEGLKRTFLNV
jgi:hypothetical protein